MKKYLALIPLLFLAQQAFAVDAEHEEAYKKHYSEQLRPMVIKKLGMDRPAKGGDVAQATQALNEELKKDIDAGKISKDEGMTIIQSAQQTVQICANS